jgi:phosphoribosylformylglycinamidine synthase
MPTQTIGAVGILADLGELIAGEPAEGDVAVLIGATLGHLGQSALLAEAFGIEAGDAPPVDLVAERRNGEFIRANGRALRACRDLSDGGLGLAAFEMAEGAGLGVVLDAGDIATLYGEDQARYLLACGEGQAAKLLARAAEAGVPAARVGRFGGAVVRFGSDEATLKALSASYRSAFARAVE